MKKQTPKTAPKAPRKFSEVNEEYKQIAMLLGDVEFKLDALTRQKANILQRAYELDGEANAAMQQEIAERATTEGA